MMKTGVVGAGLMGTEIALVFALAGFEVMLCDSDEQALERAIRRIETLLERRGAAGLGAPHEQRDVLALVSVSPALSSLSPCGFVTEAVFEDLEIKSALLAALDEICPAACIIASNTSTLPISSLAAALRPPRRPRFLGTHYFSPVSRMALVEVIRGFDTAEQTVSQTLELAKTIGKTPILVKDVAGFAVNRMLHALLIEAVKLVEEGVATPADLDTACRLGLGHPVGPFALMDLVTSSLTLQVQGILHDVYGERFRPPALLKQRVAAGYAGGRALPGWLGAGKAGDAA
jgi:3-hydroxybutyryl-CoA dehydrogenase